MKNFKRVLITGGAGFIGLNAVLKLLKESRAKIFNIDKIGYASDLTGIQEALKTLGKESEDRYEFERINLLNSNFLEDFYSDIGSIANLIDKESILKLTLSIKKVRDKNKGRIFIQKQTVKKTLNLLLQLIKRDS